ncbi:MAG: flippase [Candidatus Omnitrophica bacterium]|nr:flippase [Candidatus Omnitrophota bacterium]
MTAHTVSWWRVTRNIIFLSLRELLNKGTYLILGIVIARSMGRTAFGDYALSLLLARTFFTIGDFGFGTWLVREVSQSRERAGHFFYTVGLYRIATGVLVLLLLGGFLLVFPYASSLKRHMLLSGFSFFFIHLISFILNFFRAFEKMEGEWEVSLSKNLFLMGGGVFALTQKSLDLFFGMFILSSLVGLVHALWLYRRRIGWRGMAWEPMRLSGVIPLWLIQSVVTLYLYLDTVLLSFFRDIAEVGLYQAAYSFLEVLFVASAILTTVAFPVFSRLAKGSTQQLLAFYEELLRTVFFLFIPFGILALFGARTLLLSFYGTSFQGALPALYILLSGSLFFIFGGLNGHFLIAMGKERMVLGLTFFCTLLNLVLNLWAIPRFGFLGASAVTLLSEAVTFSLMGFQIARTFGGLSFVKGGSMPWLLLLWTLFLSTLTHLSFWILLPTGLLLYGLLAWLLHRRLSKELRAIKALWKELVF